MAPRPGGYVPLVVVPNDTVLLMFCSGAASVLLFLKLPLGLFVLMKG